VIRPPRFSQEALAAERKGPRVIETILPGIGYLPRREGLNQVTVKKDELMDALRTNMSEHRDMFEKAQKGFREQVIELLDRRLKDARDGKKVELFIGLTEPQDHTSDYERAIRMLEMSVDDEITMSARDFEQFVMDNWEWKRNFVETSAMYVGRDG
jgi:hypothetical protein